MGYKIRAVIVLGWNMEELIRILWKYRESNTMSR